MKTGQAVVTLFPFTNGIVATDLTSTVKFRFGNLWYSSWICCYACCCEKPALCSQNV